MYCQVLLYKLSQVNKHPTVVLLAETGSGKTTQVCTVLTWMLPSHHSLITRDLRRSWSLKLSNTTGPTTWINETYGVVCRSLLIHGRYKTGSPPGPGCEDDVTGEPGQSRECCTLQNEWKWVALLGDSEYRHAILLEFPPLYILDEARFFKNKDNGSWAD